MKRGKTWKLYQRGHGFYEWDEPGRYAAVTTQKIVGRLDCPSGKRALPQNRIFLLHLDDKPRGYRTCKICRPERIHAADRLSYCEPRAIRLERKPHVSLWATGMLRKDGKTYEPYRWYVALNWYSRHDGRWVNSQHTLSPHYRFHKALSRALEEGRRLNLPVIKHGVVDFTVLVLPKRRSLALERQLVTGYMTGEIRSIHGDGVISCG